MTTHELRAALIAAEKEEKAQADQNFIDSFEPFLGKYFFYGMGQPGRGEFLGLISYATKSKTKLAHRFSDEKGNPYPMRMDIPTRTVQINLYDVKGHRTCGIMRDEQSYASFESAYQLSEHHLREATKEQFNKAWEQAANIALDVQDSWLNPKTAVVPWPLATVIEDPLPGRKVYLPPTTTP